MLAPRGLSRRSVVVFALFASFIVALFFASSRMGALCEDGSYCDVSAFRHRLSFGGSGKPCSPGSGDAIVHSGECAHFPDVSNVLLVMKTGASESYGKIPNQIMTTLKCVPDYLFFGDMAQKVAGHTIHDSLDTVIPDVKMKNKDFKLYHRQQQCPIDLDSCNKNHNVGQEAWSLDKYKNIHMAEKAYAMRPNHDWYLFVDADTYVVWPTMMKWLSKLNPKDPLYIGSVAYLGNFPFGHGGSGYLVSQAAMSKLFHGKSGVANRWDERVTHECCGDYMFSKALHTETGVNVKNAVCLVVVPQPRRRLGIVQGEARLTGCLQWPTINGEKPHTLPYAENEWCQPIVTMHHAGAQEVSDIYAFEKGRNFSDPLRIKDLYHEFVEDQLVVSRNDWNNLSDDVFYLNRSASSYSDWELGRAKKGDLSALEAAAHRSFDDCRKACDGDQTCLQYRFWNGICSFSKTIKHGSPTKLESEAWWRYKSGWNIKRIKEWVAAHDTCGSVDFPIKSWP
ncbi:glycosyltransferase family 31 protein [Purpureocillium lavendulum]|uniref:N-acetylgalactosaminide beta-1,3-galactosyltransferase n=1 Tax=Purpureocillium lavendulum TaxID=1247861 RepID=A0AB34FUR7_9HYPO|nr:glycosyltransferase family 31 protein [Purpureocillium lavendulum]